jgi:hypothetical protein
MFKPSESSAPTLRKTVESYKAAAMNTRTRNLQKLENELPIINTGVFYTEVEPTTLYLNFARSGFETEEWISVKFSALPYFLYTASMQRLRILFRRATSIVHILV